MLSLIRVQPISLTVHPINVGIGSKFLQSGLLKRTSGCILLFHHCILLYFNLICSTSILADLVKPLSVTGEDTPENVSSLSMLCSLWDSVKDLIMTCATTKIKVSFFRSFVTELLCFYETSPGLFSNTIYHKENFAATAPNYGRLKQRQLQ